MTDAQATRFVEVLDAMDAAIVALRDEFQALANESAGRLAELKARSEATSSKSIADSLASK